MRNSQQSIDLTWSRWTVAFSAGLMNALQCGGFFFTPTTLMPLIVTDFSIPLALSTVPIAVGKVAYVFFLVPGGMFVDRYGPRRCVLVGLIGLAALMSLYSLFVSSFWHLVFAHVCLATAASICGVPVYSVFIAQWFDQKIGLAMGLVLAGFSAAGTIIPAVLAPIASSFGWRVAMGGMCCVLWGVGVPVSYFFLRERHEDSVLDEVVDYHGLSPAGPSEASEETRLIPTTELTEQVASVLSDTGAVGLKSWTFFGFVCSYFLLQYCFGCFGENIIFYLTLDRNMSLAHASLFFSILNFSAFTSKIVGGHLGDHFDRFHVASVASGLTAFGISCLFMISGGLDGQNLPRLAEHPSAVGLFAVIFGFGYGATFNCLYSFTPIVFGRRNLGRTQSLLFGLALVGNAIGSVLTGVLRSWYGTYQRPFLVAFVACIANFFVFNVTRMSLGGSLVGLKDLQRKSKELET